jgi:hypothetical protein
MDTNYLLAREQISLMRAAAADNSEAARAHAELARGYAAKPIGNGYPHSISTQALLTGQDH